MKFSQFCDKAENTEQEQQLLQFLKQDDMEPAEKVFTKLARAPVVGKLFAAVTALGEYDSIAAFKQSEHFQHIKNWNFAIDFDKKSMFITPNETQIRKALKVFAIIGAVVALIVICRKHCCRKN